MTKQAISLGRVFNIPISLDYSWFLIFVLLTWTLAVSYFPRELTSQPVALYWFLGAVTAILLFVSVLLHKGEYHRFPTDLPRTGDAIVKKLLG